MNRTPGGGRRGSSEAMLGRPRGGMAPASSSSSPSTTTTSRRPRSSAWAAAAASRLSHAPTRAPATGETPVGRIEGVELLDHGIEERVAVGLASKAAGDEERHDVDAGRGMGDEPRRQRGLAGPRPGLPPGVGIGAGAELGPFRQLAVAADERIGGDVADLCQVGRPHELTRFGRDDIRQPAGGRGQPEPVHQPVEVRCRQLFVGPVDAAGGQPAGALAGVMLGHDSRRSGRRPRQRPPTCPPTARDPPVRAAGGGSSR